MSGSILEVASGTILTFAEVQTAIADGATAIQIDAGARVDLDGWENTIPLIGVPGAEIDFVNVADVGLTGGFGGGDGYTAIVASKGYNGATDVFQFQGDYVTETFNYSPDGTGGTLMTIGGSAGPGATMVIASGTTAGWNSVEAAIVAGATSVVVESGATLDVSYEEYNGERSPTALFTLDPGATVDFTSVSGTVGTEAIDGSHLHATGVSVTPSSGVFPGEQYSIPLGGDYSAETFTWGTDSNGHPEVVASATLPCYLAGTRILTARGEVAVEDLAVGDLALTLHGDGAPMKPIIWIGRAGFNATQHPRPEAVWPIRIKKNALGDAMPSRDLLVSPHHAIRFGDHFALAQNLVNGATILRDSSITRGVYFHIELASHTVVLAENVPAETYQEWGNRDAFENNIEHLALYPDAAPSQQPKLCLPLLKQGDALCAIKADLRQRAVDQGFALTDEPALALWADGQLFAPATIDGVVYQFILPPNAADVFLVSRRYVPAHTRAGNYDNRQLGVFVCNLQIDDAPVALDGNGWVDGWHGIEGRDGIARRWTNGAARLPAGGSRVRVVISKPAKGYWSHQGVHWPVGQVGASLAA